MKIMSAVIGRVIDLYMRVLMCGQVLLAISNVFSYQPPAPLALKVVHVWLDIVLAVIGLAVVLFMRRGRWWAVAAIIVEACWTVRLLESAARNGVQEDREDFYMAAVISATVLICVLIRPFFAYPGLAARRR